jgi:polar amino acid transport system permease protein
VPVLYQRITGTRMSADPYLVGLIALSCNSGAYQTELIRSGIQSVDKGQWEAGETLGIPYPVMMKEIILPQAFKLIIPPLVSEFITLIKDSSLISNIGALELLYSAQVLGKRYYDYLDPLILAGIMYLCMTVVTSYLSKKVERRMAQSD